MSNAAIEYIYRLEFVTFDSKESLERFVGGIYSTRHLFRDWKDSQQIVIHEFTETKLNSARVHVRLYWYHNNAARKSTNNLCLFADLLKLICTDCHKGRATLESSSCEWCHEQSTRCIFSSRWSNVNKTSLFSFCLQFLNIWTSSVLQKSGPTFLKSMVLLWCRKLETLSSLGCCSEKYINFQQLSLIVWEQFCGRISHHGYQFFNGIKSEFRKSVVDLFLKGITADKK